MFGDRDKMLVEVALVLGRILRLASQLLEQRLSHLPSAAQPTAAQGAYSVRSASPAWRALT